MTVCPYCGNEIEEYDCICGKCGMTIEQNGNSSYNSNTYGNNNSYNNAYGNSNNTYGNNKYEYQNGGNYSYNSDGNYNYPPYNSTSYPPYNPLDDSSNTSGKNKKQGGGLFIGIAIVIVLAVIGAIVAPIVRDSMTKEYRYIVQGSVTAITEEDYLSFAKVSLFDYDQLLNDLSGSNANWVNSFLNEQTEKNRKQLREKYGDNYKITTEIKNVSSMSDRKKKEAIDKAKSELKSQSLVAGMNINVDDYLDGDSIEKIKRLRVKVKISGSKKTTKEDLWIDVAKVKGESAWKVLAIYERKNK